jgi:hypothetical protein
MIVAGITKEALGLRPPPKYFYVAIGMDELRLVGAFFVFFLLMIVLMFGVSLVVGLLSAVVGALAAAFGSAATTIVAGLFGFLIGLTAECAVFYLLTRLSFLVLPVTIVEKRIGIFRSWELTKGNFWRIFAVGFVTWAPFMLLSIVLEVMLFAPILASLGTKPQPADPAVVMRAMISHFESFVPYLPLVWIAFVLVTPVFYGLIIAPAAFAYRALVPVMPEDIAVFGPEPGGAPASAGS